MKYKNTERLDHFPNRKNKIARMEWQLWLFALPAIIFLIFHYSPMYGLVIAFKNYTPARGISASKWVGLQYFKRFLNSSISWHIIRNTLILSFYQLLVTFPFPVILALLLNHMRNKKGVKLVQTITYAPHFISLVVMSGMLFLFFSPNSGVVNVIIRKIGYESIYFMGEEKWYRHLFVFSHVWQHTGYNAVIFLAALTAVDQSQYEAATIDGASIRQRFCILTCLP